MKLKQLLGRGERSRVTGECVAFYAKKSLRGNKVWKQQ